MLESALVPEHPILLVDDERAWLRSLSMTLKGSGGYNHLVQCQDSREVSELLADRKFSLLILDLTMPHLSGDELLPMVVEKWPELPVIVLSGMNQLETAVHCMQLGAFDYFVKTGETERLLTGIRRALEHGALQKENLNLKERLLHDDLQHPEAFSSIVTRSRRMRGIFQYLEAIAASREPLLITGESGVGKELVARAAHNLSGVQGDLLAVNVASLDDNIFSDTLFGHARGAFTGADQMRSGMIEKAAGGTLFLDDIGDLSNASQAKLLRILQEGEYFPLGSDQAKKVRTRFMFATNADLAAKQAAGEFRSDLYYRLFTHHVHIPALRARREDLPLLLNHFLEEAAAALGKESPTPPSELHNLLQTYPFPGNVRELKAMVFNAVSAHSGGVMSSATFRAAIEAHSSNHSASFQGASDLHATTVIFPEQLPTLEEVGQLLVNEAMRRAGNNQTVASRLLGITRQALSKRLKKTPS